MTLNSDGVWLMSEVICGISLYVYLLPTKTSMQYKKYWESYATILLIIELGDEQVIE